MGQEIYTAIISVSILLLILALIIPLIIINYKKKQEIYLLERRKMQEEFEKQLMQSQLEVQEYSFHQISEELHDNVGQLLSTTKMLLGITERNLGETPDSLRTASETLGKAIQDLRSLSKSLSNEWLHQFNIIENLQGELDRLKAAKQIEVSLKANVHVLPLEPQEQVMLFRVMQEALQNSIKHARASEIQVSIEVRGDIIYLCLSDNGLGFNMDEAGKNGVGMMNMKHRVKLLNGSIEWTSSEASGTKVEINLPVQKPVV